MIPGQLNSLKAPHIELHPKPHVVNTTLTAADRSGIVSHPKKKNASPDSPPTGDTQHEKLVEQARKWVAQTFFGTMLKQMRQSPFKSELFEGGRGGQAYNELYDQKMVEHMSRGAGSKLVNAIARKLDAKKAYEKQQGVVGSVPEKGSANQGPSPRGTGNLASNGRQLPVQTPNPLKKQRTNVASAGRS